ncbi:hypothetical protein NBG4_130042 [Candidatus Sulfobium mesophilum]|uniref:Uncharacterized protein n=1 Tax=Candidatus Sulfobium mesophilum TaxID=2016548 RepID=A0A2U3QF29_9BACT|nr:hypothetical protein NBG4_130042 [Candidatus Sulfobium mesophilum]
MDYTCKGRFAGHIFLAVSLIEKRLARLRHFPPALALNLFVRPRFFVSITEEYIE